MNEDLYKYSNYMFVLSLQGEGVERLLIKGKKPDQVEEIDGDTFRYFLLAGGQFSINL